MEKHPKEPWRIIVGILSIIFIVFMWVKEDIVTIYSTMQKEQIAPLVVTSIAVTLVKVVGITAVILFIKWIVGKVKNRKK